MTWKWGDRMKIGIITFHRAANYGAVLQAYALQFYLTEKGNEVEIIDYRCKEIEKVHSPFYFLYIKGAKNKIKQFLRFPVRLNKRRIFDDFLNRKITLSIGTDKRNLKVLLQEKYDIVIAGSDQIWNPELIHGDTAYMLDFVPDSMVKISYAASFGLERLDVKTMALYKKYISRFEKLSLREQQGVAICGEVCDKEAVNTLDPTFLLRKKDWERFMTAPKYNNYVLLYMIKYSRKLIQTAQKLAESKGKQLIFISDSMRRIRGIQYVSSAVPEEWVGLFYNAAYVVTNSFHGTAFSINFNKKMIVEGNTRITDLLDKLAVKYVCEDSVIDLRENINWESVNAALDALREESCRFLECVNMRKGTG